jgi:hypothetical protein
MAMISGSGGYLVMGGTKIPVTDVSLKVRPMPALPPGWKMLPDSLFQATVTWEFTWNLDAMIAVLEAYRWSEYLTRQFRGRPGVRFADLMRGVGRN